jgi:hypothetical protein
LGFVGVRRGLSDLRAGFFPSTFFAIGQPRKIASTTLSPSTPFKLISVESVISIS